MSYPRKQNRFTALGGLLFLLLLTSPAAAHKVEMSGDVGGTSHIEPNDTPRAGEPSLTWFALTRQGGELIPLDACNCKLAIYAAPHVEGSQPLQEPPLSAVSAEGYSKIPGATLTFPQVGAYEMVIQGEPITPGDFQPFEIEFPVTVAAGQASPSPTPEAAMPSPETTPAAEPAQPASSPSTTHSSWLPWVLVTALIAIGLGLIVRQRLSGKSKE